MPLDCSPYSASSSVPCPGDDALWSTAICDLLPRGFAWDAAEVPGTLMNGRVRALGHMFQAFHEAACLLPLEFRCDTQTALTRADWLTDYGLPDICGINDLCAKVTSLGGQRCEDIVALGAAVGVDICCNELPPEMQCNQWDLGCTQMAPKAVPRGGGSELGFAQLGCPIDTSVGSGLGIEMTAGDCNVAGESQFLPDLVAVDPPCVDVTISCAPWFPEPNGTLIVGCKASYDISHYTGTAYHIEVGVVGSSAILADPAYAQMGQMELGCSSLCTPPIGEMLCFVLRAVPAHVVPILRYC